MVVALKGQRVGDNDSEIFSDRIMQNLSVL